MPIKFDPMDITTATHLRNSGLDSNGNPPEQQVSNGNGVPCRVCMKMVGQGEPYLIVGWRPFSATHAYAETGPVFLHAHECTPDPIPSGTLPEFLQSPNYILRGYDADERIVYGTGGVIKLEDLQARMEELLSQSNIEAVHIRSSRNNCYHCKAVRTG